MLLWMLVKDNRWEEWLNWSFLPFLLPGELRLKKGKRREIEKKGLTEGVLWWYNGDAASVMGLAEFHGVV